jgi:hypothetical protein
MGVDGDGADIGLAPDALFGIAWDALADVLGTAAVAAIVRRAVGAAVAETPELADVVVSFGDLEYRYTLPHAWSQRAERGPQALRVLVGHIGRLLVELTGTAVIRRLEQIPELRASGLVWRAEEAN